MTGQKSKAEGMVRRYRRTTLCVDPELYREFKVHAARQGVSVTALITGLMRQALGLEKTERP